MANIPLRSMGENGDSENEKPPQSNRRTISRRFNSAVANNVLFSQEKKSVYYDKYTCIPNCKDHVGGPPIFIVTITIVQIAVFIYYATTSSNEAFLLVNKAMIASPLIFNPFRREEAWRFLTYMFLHSGIYHILANSIVQLLFGIPLELVHGSLRVMGIYLAGVICGSLASSVFDVGTWLVGASGGDFALMFAFIANIIMNWDSMSRCFAILRIAFVSAFVVTDFVVSVWERYNGDDTKHTSYAAHLGGAVCGLTLGVIILKNFQKQLWEDILFKVSIGIFCILILAAAIFNIVCPCYDGY